MQIGQMVFYRLSRNDADRVNYRRRRGVENMTKHKQTDDGSQIHFGIQVEEGQLLPATVVVAYNAHDKGYHGGREHIEGTDARFSFSGVADIRVLLPGNDVLFVQNAVEDTNCLANGNMGHGITALPDYGMFTQSQPADLLS